MVENIVVDTDGVYDDLLALFLLFGATNTIIKGITLVNGAIKVDKSFANIEYLLKKLNLLGKIPLIPSSYLPSNPDWQTCEQTLGFSGFGNQLIIPSKKLIISPNQMLSFYKNIKNPFTLLSLGPLTNVAEIIKDVKIKKNIKKIVSMGGNINVAGNTENNAEFNYNADPKALKEVLFSKIPFIIVPLDLTRKVYFPAEKLVKKIDTKKPGGVYLYKIFSFYIKATRRIKKNAFHDPITASIVIDSSLAQYKKRYLQVTKEGQLITNDKRKSLYEAYICIDFDKDRLLKLFMKSVYNLQLLL